MVQKVGRIISRLWGRTPLASPFGRADDDRETVARYIARNPIPSLQRRPVSWMLALTAWLMWFFRAPVAIVQLTGQYGRRSRSVGAPGLPRQLADMTILALRYRVHPDHYHQFRLFNRPLHEARRFWSNHELATLFRLLNSGSEDVVENKLAFSEFLTKHGFATPTTLAIAEHKAVLSDATSGNGPPPGQSLIVKPNEGMRGRGVVRYHATADGDYEYDGDRFTYDDIWNTFLDRSQETRMLLQVALRNHRDFREAAPDSLSCVRIISGKKPTGEVAPLAAILKAPNPRSSVDNLVAGGVAARVDVETGAVGTAVNIDMLSPTFEAHPATGLQLVGMMVPEWQRILETVTSAHHVMDGFVFLGWDIAITDEGPVVIEANATWDGSLAQRPGFRPLGDTGFDEVASDWIRFSTAKEP